MAEETYGIQESIKSGNDMLNIRGADADEFLAVYQGLIDSADDNAVAAALVEKYDLGGEEEAKPAPKKRASRAKPKPEPEEDDDAGEDDEYDDEDDEPEEKPARRTRKPAARKSTAARSRRTR